MHFIVEERLRLGRRTVVDATNVQYDSGPFDSIGDVHGCRSELETLLDQLGCRGDEKNLTFIIGIGITNLKNASHFFFAFHEAVQQYNPMSQSNGKPASFKTVLAHSFLNYCRQRKRYRKRFVLNLDGEASPNLIVDAEKVRHFSLYPTDGTDGSLVEWKEMLRRELSSARLAEVLSKLKPICTLLQSLSEAAQKGNVILQPYHSFLMAH